VSKGLSRDEMASLYEKYAYFLLRRCRTILRDDAAADDALQQAFEQVFRRGAAVRAADQPLRWLYSVVDRACFDVLRHRKVRLRITPPPAGSTDPVEDAPDPAHPQVDVEMRDAVMKLLAFLSDRERRLAIMFFLDGMSQDEIAQQVGLSRVTVNKHVQALRAKSRSYLERVA
jgi:RNA polymerase sigma-70 factor, ECF subfamily